MKIKHITLLVILIFVMVACQKYVGSISVPQKINKVGVIIPSIDLRISEQKSLSGKINLLSKKNLKAVPKDLLTSAEKEFLNSLLDQTLFLCEEKLAKPLSKIRDDQHSEIITDFGSITGIDNNNIQTNSYGLVNRDFIGKIIEPFDDKMLNYVIISDTKTENFNPVIDTKTGHNELIVKRAEYKDFVLIEETRTESLVPIDDRNYIYRFNQFNEIDLKKTENVKEICSLFNLDALMKIDLKFKFERLPTLLEYKWRIRLEADIKIVDNSGNILNENTVTGKSDYLKISKEEFNKLSTDVHFIYHRVSDSEVNIFEIYPRSEYSFSLDNIFGPLYEEAVSDFLSRLSLYD